MKSLEGKVAIVAGGGRDIGRAVSVELAEQGAKVVVNYFNNEEEGAATLAAIKDAGGEATAIPGDMTKQEDVDALVAKAVETYGDKLERANHCQLCQTAARRSFGLVMPWPKPL